MRKDFSADAIGLKRDLLASKEIEAPRVDLLTGEEFAKRELQEDWYRRADESVKKLDEVTSRPTVLMAIQGMWVGDESQVEELPFSRCSDEVDALKAFGFRDPRMLIELVERNMVDDISAHIRKYLGSRQEPP